MPASADRPEVSRAVGPNAESGPAGVVDEAPLSDEELTALALASDADQPLGDDAVPIGVYLGRRPGPLPEWYMPAATARVSGRWRPVVVGTVVAAFVIIEAFGLCNTYGLLSLA